MYAYEKFNDGCNNRYNIKVKTMNHLKYYKECLKTGVLKGNSINVCNGLCYEPEIDQELLALFIPTLEDQKEHNVSENYYWAADGTDYVFDYGIRFTKLRQTIVLFIAAMRNEL